MSLSLQYPSTTSDLHVSTVRDLPSEVTLTSIYSGIGHHLSGLNSITRTQFHTGLVSTSPKLVLYAFTTGFAFQCSSLAMMSNSLVRVSRRDESNAYSSYCYEHNFQTTTDHTLASTTCLPEQGHCLGVEHGQQHFSRTQRFNHTLFRRCVTGVKILILAYHISTQACWLRFVTQ
jgi:hypothetical protein